MALESLAGMFSASLIGSSQINPGKPVRFQLSPSDLSNIKLPSIVPADLNLTWISKNVLFENEGIEEVFSAENFDLTAVDDLVLGKLPVRLPRVGSGLTTLLYEEIQQGVQGLLSQLRGSLPVVMDLQLQVSAQWNVFDSETSTTPLTSGFVALSPMNSFEVSLLFEPVIVELTNSTVLAFVDRFVEVQVTLTLGTETFPFTLPRIKVSVPAVPIPRLAAFFLHVDFQPAEGDDEGAVFIVVPNNSPLRNLTQLQGVLDTLESILDSLTSFADLAAFLLGVRELSNVLAAQPHVQLRVADGSNNFNNFNDVTLKSNWMGWLFGWSNTEVEDELSSMIYIGPPRSAVQCFNERDRKSGDGAFTLTAGNLCHAKINNLHTASPTVTPAGASISVTTTPPAGVFSPSDFGDELSSLSFP